MSNQVTIQRRKVKNLDTDRSWLEAHIFDDYGSLDSVMMEPLPIGALALFERLVATQTTDGTVGVHDILSYIFNAKIGVTVGNDYVPFESLKQILTNYMGFSDYE